jgi:hypothetical protein
MKITSVLNKKKYYKLDEIGIIGTQEKKSLASEKYHSKKTGEIFRAARRAAIAKKTALSKKAS